MDKRIRKAFHKGYRTNDHQAHEKMSDVLGLQGIVSKTTGTIHIYYNV